MNHPLTKQQLTTFILKHRFSDLFIQLGWDKENLPAEPLMLKLRDGENFSVARVVEKRGFVVCVCNAGVNYPSGKSERRRLVNQLARHHYEHLLIICGEGRQCWTVAIRPQNRPLRTVEVEWNEGQDIQPLMEKLDGLIFDISKEATLGITDVVDKVHNAFMEHAKKVTKDFYGCFQKELSTFSEFIQGIKEQTSKEWYAALMLNRLMFIYFIQKKRFLDGDVNYLENRLTETKTKFGADKFHDRFYRNFLRRLFSEGLGMPESARDPELKKMLGKVPYLNGGLFDVHQVERENDHIEIPDKVFENLFKFFHKYTWRLDSRPTASGKDINPDVIGYIFEKYIIDRAAMGAYYTQEDVTGYITRNTVTPFLLHRAREKCKNAFDPENGIWRFLRENPDNYIYDAVRKGCDIPDEEIPENIRRGLDTTKPHLIKRRKDWNTPTDEKFALPTEIWRETMARRKRYGELKAKIENGDIHKIDDLITYNLDIERFATDALRYYEGSDFINAFYSAIAGKKALKSNHHSTPGITILDPACGSGAFLFAALNILEPLYERCIERMRDFVEEDDKLRDQGKRKGTKKHPQFREVLENIERHQNEKYWIYKTIILNNLYGVDLMKEATEITKLRLFLKLAAEAEYDPHKNNLGLEPLPDIDFNIRSGNSLVGFASMRQFEEVIAIYRQPKQQKFDFYDELVKEIREQAWEVQKANEKFRKAQDSGDDSYRGSKDELSIRLADLNEKMNRYLAKQYGQQKEEDYRKWLQSHQPFHWLTEFYGIVEEDDGFDVVIGNPPYVATQKINYTVIEDSFCDIYANMVIRSSNLVGQNGNCGMIIPLSITFSSDYRVLRQSVCNLRIGKSWFSSYDNIPASIFSGVSQRCTIFLKRFSNGIENQGTIYVSPMYRWKAESRKFLTNQVGYCELGKWDLTDLGIPKLASNIQFQILQAIHNHTNSHEPTFSTGESELGFSPTARNFVSVFSDPPPCIDSKTMQTICSNRPIPISFHGDKLRDAILASLTGDLYFWYWLSRGDGFHVTKWIIGDFAKCIQSIPGKYIDLLSILGNIIQARKNEALVFKKNAGKYVGNYNYTALRSLTKRADLLVMASLGLSIEHAREIFSYVTRILSINTSAGEKAIPDTLKRKFQLQEYDKIKESHLLHKIDEILRSIYGLETEELDYIINYDIKYRMGLGNEHKKP